MYCRFGSPENQASYPYDFQLWYSTSGFMLARLLSLVLSRISFSTFSSSSFSFSSPFCLLHQNASPDDDNDLLILIDSFPPSLPPSLPPPPPPPPPPVRQRSSRAAWKVQRQKPSSRPFSSLGKKRSIRSSWAGSEEMKEEEEEGSEDEGGFRPSSSLPLSSSLFWCVEEGGREGGRAGGRDMRYEINCRRGRSSSDEMPSSLPPSFPPSFSPSPPPPSKRRTWQRQRAFSKGLAALSRERRERRAGGREGWYL